MKKSICTLILSATILFVVSGCVKKSDVENASGATDSQNAMLIYSAFSTVFSQITFTPTDNPVGNIDQTVNSPAGGYAKVTGTATYDEVSQRVNWMLVFGWYSYRVNDSTSDYTLNGQMNYNGFANSAGTSQSHLNSSLLTLRGTVNGSSVNIDLDFSFDVKITNGHGSISGDMQGRSFSYSF